MLVTLHLSWGSSVSGQASSRRHNHSGRGWCSGRGWPAGSRLLALHNLHSTDVPCGPLRVKGGHLALPPPGAAVWSGEQSGSSAGCWAPAEAGYPTVGETHAPDGWKLEGHGGGWGRGLLLLAQAWSEWGNHMDSF